MLNTGRAVAATSLALAAWAAVLAYGAWRLTVGPGDSVWSIVVGVGGALGIVVVLFWVLSIKGWLRTRRLMRPDQRIASWQVSPATWEAFRALEAGIEATEGNMPNLLRPGRKPVAAPVPVIAAKGALLIGGRLYEVEPRGMLAVREVRWNVGAPECLNFVILQTIVRGGNASMGITRTWVALRVPVAPAQREAAVAAFAHYRDAVARGEVSDPRPSRIMVRGSLVLAALGMVSGAAGLWMNHAGILQGSLVPLLLAVIGLTGALGALVVAGVVWLVMLRKRG